MKKYNVTITPNVYDKLNQYLSYLLFVIKSKQAFDAVKKDFKETIEELSRVALSLQDPPEIELRKRNLKRIHFRRHKYILLYWLDGDEAVVVYIFHESEDYLNKLE